MSFEFTLCYILINNRLNNRIDLKFLEKQAMVQGFFSFPIK